ncbi:hypothetical protein [Streptomyces sp. NPDC093591]|uniref:hypothetical protein n=1 Tax=Streptomyces sp. NPDC093591 TaxID=3366044 RepID=UPI003805D722
MRHPVILSPRLPLATRARLRAERRVDGAAYWLIVHGFNRAAVRLWKACGMW